MWVCNKALVSLYLLLLNPVFLLLHKSHQWGVFATLGPCPMLIRQGEVKLFVVTVP